jgi:tryptophan 2,3-dioxygenase
VERTAPTGTPAGQLAAERIAASRRETSLRAALQDWLYRTPIQGSAPGDASDAEAVTAFVESYLQAMARLQEEQIQHMVAAGAGTLDAIAARIAAAAQQAASFLHADDAQPASRARTQRLRAGLLFIESYRELPLLAWPRLLVDTIVELEEQLVLWRTRHARMVERTIGRRMGTGGSAGVDYLDATTRYRIFTELWEVRTLLLPRRALPPLRNAALYGFAR